MLLEEGKIVNGLSVDLIYYRKYTNGDPLDSLNNKVVLLVYTGYFYLVLYGYFTSGISTFILGLVLVYRHQEPEMLSFTTLLIPTDKKQTGQ